MEAVIVCISILAIFVFQRPLKRLASYTDLMIESNAGHETVKLVRQMKEDQEVFLAEGLDKFDIEEYRNLLFSRDRPVSPPKRPRRKP